MNSTDIIATGFVADTSAEATSFPSAGKDSSNAAFQAIYWRCIAVFFFSARLFAPDSQRILFSNVTPPVVDGVDLAQVFAAMGVQCVRLPLTHRLGGEGRESWGNVFYVLDIIDYLLDSGETGLFTLFDSDVVLTSSVEPLFERIAQSGFAGYRVDSAADEDVNGCSMRQLTALAARMGGSVGDTIVHWGGELFAADLSLLRGHRPALDMLWAWVSRPEPGSVVKTEEHFWSLFFAAHDLKVAAVNDVMARLWTSLRYNTVQPGDERLAIWHLPAEKRYGFIDMFRWMRVGGFDVSVSPARWRRQALAAFGIPRRGPIKYARDLLRAWRIATAKRSRR